MKKAKVMLLSVAILAVVAGALAFKSNKVFGFRYCYTTLTTIDPNAPAQPCTLVTVLSKKDPNATQFFYAKIKPTGTCASETCPPLSIIPEN
jgi:hypothetical protein